MAIGAVIAGAVILGIRILRPEVFAMPPGFSPGKESAEGRPAS
jgi:hypothetical protein